MLRKQVIGQVPGTTVPPESAIADMHQLLCRTCRNSYCYEQKNSNRFMPLDTVLGMVYQHVTAGV
jgi:hypothetical protein